MTETTGDRKQKGTRLWIIHEWLIILKPKVSNMTLPSNSEEENNYQLTKRIKLSQQLRQRDSSSSIDWILVGHCLKSLLMGYSRVPDKPGPQFPHFTQGKGDNTSLNISSPRVSGSCWVLRGTQWCRIIFGPHHGGCRQEAGTSETHSQQVTSHRSKL